MMHHRNAPLAWRPNWAVALLLAVLALVGSTNLVSRAAAGEDAPPGRVKLPADLDLVPRDAPGFGSIRVAELWTSDEAASLRKLVEETPEISQMLTIMEKAVGLKITDIERVTLIAPPPDSRAQPIFIVSTVKPFDRDKVLGKLVPDAKEMKTAGGKSYFTSTEGRAAVSLVNNRTFVASQAKEMEEFLEHPAKKGEGPLSEALAQAAQKNRIVAGLNGPALAKDNKKNLPPPLAPLAEAKSATVTINTSKEDVTVEVRLPFATEEAAMKGEKAAEAGLEMARKALPMARAHLEKQPAEKDSERMIREKMVRSLKDLETSLKTAAPQRKGSVVVGTLRVKTADPVGGLLLLLMPRGGSSSSKPPEGKPVKRQR
jgi:hypothetical protein